MSMDEKQTILIVDDSLLICEQIKAALKEESIIICEAQDVYKRQSLFFTGFPEAASMAITGRFTRKS